VTAPPAPPVSPGQALRDVPALAGPPGATRAGLEPIAHAQPAVEPASQPRGVIEAPVTRPVPPQGRGAPPEPRVAPDPTALRALRAFQALAPASPGLGLSVTAALVQPVRGPATAALARPVRGPATAVREPAVRAAATAVREPAVRAVATAARVPSLPRPGVLFAGALVPAGTRLRVAGRNRSSRPRSGTTAGIRRTADGTGPGLDGTGRPPLLGAMAPETVASLTLKISPARAPCRAR
jgi:hypothetical protein